MNRKGKKSNVVSTTTSSASSSSSQSSAVSVIPLNVGSNISNSVSKYAVNSTDLSPMHVLTTVLESVDMKSAVENIFKGYALIDKIDGKFGDLQLEKKKTSLEIKRNIGVFLKGIKESLFNVEIDADMRKDIMCKVSTACYGTDRFVELKHGS